MSGNAPAPTHSQLKRQEAMFGKELYGSMVVLLARLALLHSHVELQLWGVSGISPATLVLVQRICNAILQSFPELALAECRWIFEWQGAAGLPCPPHRLGH